MFSTGPLTLNCDFADWDREENEEKFPYVEPETSTIAADHFVLIKHCIITESLHYVSLYFILVYFLRFM